MRSTLMGGSVLGLVLLASALRAEPAVPFTLENRTITPAEVEVRSGASPSFYATGKLARGEIVRVVTNKKDVPEGWLAIAPPRHSFSWVNARFIRYQPDQTTGVVLSTGTEILSGSAMNNAPPTVRSAVLDRGAMVVILGQPLLASDGSRWLPIEPHPTEVRYIPASAVLANPAGADAVASRGSGSSVPASSGIAPAGAAAGNRGSLAPSPAATSLYGPNPAGTAQTVSSSAAPATPPTEQWTGPGWLRKTDFEFESKPIYRLETYEKVICYVVAQPGFSLDSYLYANLKHPVYLYGPISYRAEMSRAPILAARAGQAAQ